MIIIAVLSLSRDSGIDISNYEKSVSLKLPVCFKTYTAMMSPGVPVILSE